MGMVVDMSIYIKCPECIQGINSEQELFIEETFAKHREKAQLPRDE
jgi:hypothetical protein